MMIFSKACEVYNNIIDSIKKIYTDTCGVSDTELIEVVFNDVIDLFNGERKGFQGCDAKYHDFSHTLQTIPPFIEIIHGWNKANHSFKISKNSFDSGIIAVLLHDTGYMKTTDDREGTGAKYTFIHIQRSVDFAGSYLPTIGLQEHQVVSVQNAIHCTGVRVILEDIHFTSEEERILGYALGTADFLGQMSAPDYVEKLPILYREYEEAYNFEGLEKLKTMGALIFNNQEHLIKNTPNFFENIVLARFRNMGSVFEYLTYHYNTSSIPYLIKIQRNLDRIRTLYGEP
ncbi:MAG TPA: hypothetical protein DDW17_02450 [Deltaproteobacteria bacterium]|nr:hypothetical protein [Deltaproteobacteria bacterium]